MAAPIRAPFGTVSVIGGLKFGVKISPVPELSFLPAPYRGWTGLGENLSLTLKDVIVGILNRNDLLNCLIILGKLCIWDCRRNKSLPKFNIFLEKVQAKQAETDKLQKLIASKNKNLQDFWKR